MKLNLVVQEEYINADIEIYKNRIKSINGELVKLLRLIKKYELLIANKKLHSKKILNLVR